MIDCLHPRVSAKRARVVLFDFDGTVSLIRSGWMDVMIPMMVEVLMDLNTRERNRNCPRWSRTSSHASPASGPCTR
jgi:hypothetical protein